jgi:hypothetical protein
VVKSVLGYSSFPKSRWLIPGTRVVVKRREGLVPGRSQKRALKAGGALGYLAGVPGLPTR